jgi:predicted unusual protein kinase regulating ubiquinone biosynthesis (AarF/ABC1/UbiB family)
VSLKNYLGQNHPYEERRFMAALGLRAFLKMIIIDNFVHADLHSGMIRLLNV